MIEITNLRQGAVLNHNHGVETAKSLTVLIEGISGAGHPVMLNGKPANMDGRRFILPFECTEKFNNVTASVITPYGSIFQKIVLVWDKKSFRRCNFYIDDHSFLFTELTKQRPARAFDHFYLAGLKAIHAKYGLKLALNCFYHNDHHDFDLKDMPDIWKQEFVDNSDWLKLSFHAYGEFPDRPYLESSAATFARDYDLVKNEIIRFAGEQTFIPPIVLHWGDIHPSVAQELIRRGCRCYTNTFRPRVMGGPTLAERQKGGNMNAVANRTTADVRNITDLSDGLKLHYNHAEESSYLNNHRVYYDPEIGVYFTAESGCCRNMAPLAEIPKRYAQIFETAKQYGAETFGGASHEQYTFPYYPNYIPDHMQRIECAARCLIAEGGCTPVFFNDGLLGNMAWDK